LLQGYSDVMDMISEYYFTPEYTGQYTVATWFYLPLYPLVAPSVSRLNTSSYNETLYNFGQTAKPFCSYRMSDGLAQSLGIAAEVADANELCDYPAGRRFQPLTLALDNLTDCGTGNSNAAGGWSAPANWALLANGNPPSYVDNQHGARNFRSMYDDEHLDAMVEIAAAMRNVCGRGSNSDIGQWRPLALACLLAGCAACCSAEDCSLLHTRLLSHAPCALAALEQSLTLQRAAAAACGRRMFLKRRASSTTPPSWPRWASSSAPATALTRRAATWSRPSAATT
jgi:hypothetical protein